MTNRAATIDGGDFSRYRRNALALLSLSARPELGGIDVRPCDREKPPMEGGPGALFFRIQRRTAMKSLFTIASAGLLPTMLDLVPLAGDDDCLVSSMAFAIAHLQRWAHARL